MKAVLVLGALLVVGYLVVGRFVGAASQDTLDRDAGMREVASVLHEATRKAKRDRAVLERAKPTAAEARWLRAVGGQCGREARAVAALGTPRGLDGLARYVRDVRAVARARSRAIAARSAPSRYRPVAAQLRSARARRDRTLAAMAEAAERHDATGVLRASRELAALAREVNPSLARGGLAACALPVSGLPG